MRRLTITLAAGLMLLAIAPAGAAARHHHRHHSRIHHARIEHFGSDTSTAPTNSSSADTAGTVQSFAGGVLTIMLNDGSTVSGTVTGDTEIECMAPEQNDAVHEDGDGGSGDQSGDGDQSISGDDQGDAAEENEAANENENENENEDQAQNCSTSNLTPGTVVREAVLRITSAGSVWKDVELGS